MTTTALDWPPRAEALYWRNPDRWEPGLPIYDDPDTYGYGYTTERFLIEILDVHPGDCTGRRCRVVSTDQFEWCYTPAPEDRKELEEYWGVRLAGPGTTFYGAMIGPATKETAS